MSFKLAELLLRRKELQQKVDQIRSVKDRDLFEVKGKRMKVTDDTDDVVLQVPLLALSQITAEYDFYARKLRIVDAAIQQANWTLEVAADPTVMDDYVAPALERRLTKA